METKKVIFFASLFLVCSASCYSQKVISKPLPENPISYIFEVKIKDAPSFLEKGYYKYGGVNLFIHDIYYWGTWKTGRWPEIATKVLAGELNKYDVYMQVSVDSSNTYFNKKGKPFEYEMECVAHFTTIDSNNTKMEIKVLSSKVHLRNALLPSPPHFVNNPIYKNVKPTTIEEYKIIQCLGKALGISEQMPALKLQ
ncbi:MAG TPA: hypothetical protein VK668_08625 [Mucilaginibacter sp.]|nr:hypothetical protein [Mucilaginibacter sp.]